MKSGRETDGKDDHVRPVHSAQAARWTRGLAYFGPIGLLAGPLIISFFLAVVRLWDRDPPEPRRTAATSGLIGCA